MYISDTIDVFSTFSSSIERDRRNLQTFPLGGKLSRRAEG